MEILLSPEAWLAAGLIFFLRVLDMSLDTLRVLVVMRGRRDSCLGFRLFPGAYLCVGDQLRAQGSE